MPRSQLSRRLCRPFLYSLISSECPCHHFQNISHFSVLLCEYHGFARAAREKSLRKKSEWGLLVMVTERSSATPSRCCNLGRFPGARRMTLVAVSVIPTPLSNQHASVCIYEPGARQNFLNLASRRLKSDSSPSVRDPTERLDSVVMEREGVESIFAGGTCQCARHLRRCTRRRYELLRICVMDRLMLNVNCCNIYPICSVQSTTTQNHDTCTEQHLQLSQVGQHVSKERGSLSSVRATHTGEPASLRCDQKTVILTTVRCRCP